MSCKNFYKKIKTELQKLMKFYNLVNTDTKTAISKISCGT